MGILKPLRPNALTVRPPKPTPEPLSTPTTSHVESEPELSTVALALQEALADPEGARIKLDQLDCKESFHEFVKRAWPHIEPAKEFVDGWVPRVLCTLLQACVYGDLNRETIKRLICNVPPGCTKSIIVCVLFPAWVWGPAGMPSKRFVSASYAAHLSVRDQIRCRDLLTCDWYLARWPIELKDDENNKTCYKNTHGGWRFATSVGGSLTGFRGDFVLVDDPHDVKRAESEAFREEALRWWTETVPTRLNDLDESVMVLIMQRLHTSDLSGHSLSKQRELWTHLMLPMEFEPDRRCSISRIGFEDPRTEEGELLWPGRFSKRAVVELKASLSSRGGNYAVAGQLQQRPMPREGGIFKVDRINYLDVPPLGITQVVRGWDFAGSKRKKSPYTVGVKMCRHEGRIIVLDVKRERMTPGAVKTLVKTTANQDGPYCPQSIPQDPGQAGKAQVEDYAQWLVGHIVHASPESGEKDDRALPVAAQVELGNYYLVRGPWNDAYVSELRECPGGDYKDQQDATSRAFHYLVSHYTDGPVFGMPGELITGDQ